MNLNQALKWAAQQLQDKDNKYLDARILLEHIISKPHEFVIAHPNHPLTSTQITQFKQLITKRQQGVPISHIVGYKEFWGRKFTVTNNTLAPRPETEILIEQALKLKPAKILDLGTGTGCIPITLLTELPHCQAIATDISTKTLDIAAKNAYTCGVSDRLELVKNNWLSGNHFNAKTFDLVTSNPPYISELDYKKLDVELSAEPKQALTDGNDGLDCYRQIAAGLYKVTDKNTDILFEIGINQHEPITKILKQHGYNLKAQYKDLAGIIRTLHFKQQD